MINGKIDPLTDDGTYIWVDCPYCGEENELTDDDNEKTLLICIIENNINNVIISFLLKWIIGRIIP